MAAVNGVFGEVADLYDEVRPGYPADVAAAILEHHGGVPERVVEIGAGTGKGTEVLSRLGAPLTCVEPDPRMAAVLRARFPGAEVRTETFEEWAQHARGVPLIACALAWHWLVPTSRNRLAHAALAPGGTLAVFGHRYGYADRELAGALDVAIRSVEPTARERPDGWFRDDIAGSGFFTDVRTVPLSTELPLSLDRYLALLQTFGPFRKADAAQQAAGLAVVRSVLAGRHEVVLDLCTTLVLARRPA